MRRVLLLLAASVVLIGNGWAVWQSAQNRAEPRGGTLTLTERELPLQPMALESSVTLLRLNWRVDKTSGPDANAWHVPPAWLDTNKLVELGFDCRLPVTSPGAGKHYGSMPPRRVFLALEYRAEAPPEQSSKTRVRTGLILVDAGPDADRLRQRYPDREKHVICRGLVRVVLRDQSSLDGSTRDAKYLQGRIQGLTPAEVSVCVPENRLLTPLSRPGFEDENQPSAAPRFVARVRWGRNYEPWVDEVRPLEASP
jgi:hypothetical protein